MEIKRDSSAGRRTSHAPPRKIVLVMAWVWIAGVSLGLAGTVRPVWADDGGFGNWLVQATVDNAWINSKTEWQWLGIDRKLTLETDLFPVLRGTWHLSDQFAIEGGYRRDGMGNGVEYDAGGGENEGNGYTLLLGPIYRFSKFDSGFVGEWLPFIAAHFGYRQPSERLYPADQRYVNAVGGELAIGVRNGSFDARLGYGYYAHQRGEAASGLSDTTPNATVNVAGPFIEMGYCFSVGY